MGEEARNVAALKVIYELWNGSKGGSVADVFAILDDDIDWCSLGHGVQDLAFSEDCRGKDAVLRYFERLGGEWELLDCTVDEYVAQGDRVVVLGHVAFRSRQTGKTCHSRKCDVWRMKDGKAVSFSEFFDTAGAAAAAH